METNVHAIIKLLQMTGTQLFIYLRINSPLTAVKEKNGITTGGI